MKSFQSLGNGRTTHDEDRTGPFSHRADYHRTEVVDKVGVVESSNSGPYAKPCGDDTQHADEEDRR